MRVFAVILVLGWSFPLAAQQSPQSSASQGRASATVAQPIRATAVEDLSFGTFVSPRTGTGTIAVKEDGSTPELSNNLVLVCQSVSACLAHPASIAVSGDSGRQYGVSLPENLMLTGQRNGSQMRVESMNMRSRNVATIARSGNLGSDGNDIFTIGGVLSVPENSQPDQYDGDLTVTVSYF